MNAGAPLACPSPCIGVCRLGPDGDVCEGCLRTLGEIASWSGAGEEERRRIVAAASGRRESRGLAQPSRPAATGRRAAD